MNASMILDALIVLLLLPTIAFAFVLNRRLTTLRTAQDELQQLLTGFNEAAERAQTGVFQLKAAAEDAGGKLHDQIDKTRAARDELAFMVSAGNRLAERLEADMSAARGGSTNGGGAAVVEMTEHRPREEAAVPGPASDRQLLDALRRAK
jgi:methyl-accepting chemotaxis protein